MDPKASHDLAAPLIDALSRMSDAEFERAVDALKEVGRRGVIASITLARGLGPAFSSLASGAGGRHD